MDFHGCQHKLDSKSCQQLPRHWQSVTPALSAEGGISLSHTNLSHNVYGYEQRSEKERHGFFSLPFLKQGQKVNLDEEELSQAEPKKERKGGKKNYRS